MLDHGQSNRYFSFVPGVKGTWHALTHWKDASGRTEDDDGRTSWDNVDSKKDMYNAVTRWHHGQLAWLLGRLKSLHNADGSNVLDHSMIVYGSSIADGHQHKERDLPVLIAGHGSGSIKPGRYLNFENDTSMSALHLALLQRMGLPLKKFADADTPLPTLT